jgi:hypothetical protein
MSEPIITINGHVLNSAQAMTVRVALSGFSMELADPDWFKELGPIAPLYLARLTEVMEFIFKGK